MKYQATLLTSLVIFFVGCKSSPTKIGNQKEDAPKILAPNVRKVWIPPEIKNGGLEWEEGHFVYKIERNSSWAR